MCSEARCFYDLGQVYDVAIVGPEGRPHRFLAKGVSLEEAKAAVRSAPDVVIGFRISMFSRYPHEEPRR